MEMPENRRHERTARWIFTALMILVGGVSGCATVQNGMTVKTVWQVREQYVKIERQDRPTGLAVAVNAHPAEISTERLRYLLESIDVRLNDKVESLFNEDEVGVMSNKIHEGLALAGPDEDVTFAVVGHHAVLFGLKQRMITTGRLFCQGGQLNIIFGEILREVKDNEDLRLNPYRIGSRSAGEHRELQLIVKQGREAFTMKRPDWVMFPIAGPVSTVPVPTVTEKKGAAGVKNDDVQPGPPAEKPAAAGRGSIEARLKVLNDLRDKKLITEEEYRAKRREILDEL